jgi:hypothetical protein
VLVAHHQNMALGKGAVERRARFNVDRLDEVEPNDFGARVICQGRDGEGSPWTAPPLERPATIPSGSEGAALRCNTSCGVEADWPLAVAR